MLAAGLLLGFALRPGFPVAVAAAATALFGPPLLPRLELPSVDTAAAITLRRRGWVAALLPPLLRAHVHIKISILGALHHRAELISGFRAAMLLYDCERPLQAEHPDERGTYLIHTSVSCNKGSCTLV